MYYSMPEGLFFSLPFTYIFFFLYNFIPWFSSFLCIRTYIHTYSLLVQLFISSRSFFFLVSFSFSLPTSLLYYTFSLSTFMISLFLFLIISFLFLGWITWASFLFFTSLYVSSLLYACMSFMSFFLCHIFLSLDSIFPPTSWFKYPPLPTP